MSDPISRRRLLGLCGTALTTGLAGCGNESNAETADPSPTRTRSPATETPSGATDTESGAGRRTPTPPVETETERGSSTQTPESVYTQVYGETVDSVVLVRTARGQGTGWVFDDSHVVTNAHVVGSAEDADVRFTEGTWSAGEVVGVDRHSDLAAISVDERPDPAEPLSLSEDGATIGQEVVAIGNPFDLNGTVTSGIVSGVDRSIPSPTGFSIPDAIQTDAAVNPGNSGGPLMALDETVLAVINSGGGDNIAFGISAALTRRVVPELIETGSYEHAYVGASFATVTPAVAEANGLSEPRGLLVARVVDGGPADGVLESSDGTTVVDGQTVQTGGDVLLTVDDRELDTAEELGSHLALEARPDETVDLRILRDGDEQTVSLELGTRPSQPTGVTQP